MTSGKTLAESAMHEKAESFDKDELAELGYTRPIRVLSKGDAHWLARQLRSNRHQTPPDWEKSRAVIDPLIYRLANSSIIVDKLRQILGGNITLYGADWLSVPPGRMHHWHVDIETATLDSNCVSVWVGLRNCGAHSGLRVMPRSHRWDTLLQQHAAAENIPYGKADDAMVRAWAKNHVADPNIQGLQAVDGEAVFFDGKLWHSAENRHSMRWRQTLLLQYCNANTDIRIPDLNKLDWPFRFKPLPRPKKLLVSGRSHAMQNNITTPPAVQDEQLARISVAAHHYQLPLAQDKDQGWKPHDYFCGKTASLDLLAYHASVLDPGCCPHPPHIHPEEEFLIILEGEAEVITADHPRDPNPRITQLGKHQASYYPADQHHTIRNSSELPVSYLMVRWRGGTSASRWPATTRFFDIEEPRAGPATEDFSAVGLLDEATDQLSKLEIHLSTLQPGAGYAAHIDAYDLAIIVLEGDIVICDEIHPKNSIILISAGEPHDMKNPGQDVAQYLVLELHGTTLFYREQPPAIRRSLHFLKRCARFAKKMSNKALTGNQKHGG